MGQNPPIAEKIKKELVNNGNVRIDNYYWLNDTNNPKVHEYIRAENEYLKYILKPTEKLQEKLYTEMSGRIQQNDMSLSYKDNGYYYYDRYEQGKEYPVFCRQRDTINSKEEVILNENELAAGHEYFSIHKSGLRISPDNKLLAFCYQTTSSNYIMKFKNLFTGKWLKDEIKGTSDYPPVWANDSKTVFYSVEGQTGGSGILKTHIIGEDLKKDKVVYSEKNEALMFIFIKANLKNILSYVQKVL